MERFASKQFSYIWHKYRPVILRLMISSVDGPQQYQFSDHEFRRMDPKQKKGFEFILYVYKSKALNNIKTSVLAADLLKILQDSKTAAELTSTSTYEFVLDKNFILHVKKSTDAAEGVTNTGRVENLQGATA